MATKQTYFDGKNLKAINAWDVDNMTGWTSLTVGTSEASPQATVAYLYACIDARAKAMAALAAEGIGAEWHESRRGVPMILIHGPDGKTVASVAWFGRSRAEFLSTGKYSIPLTREKCWSPTPKPK